MSLPQSFTGRYTVGSVRSGQSDGVVPPMVVVLHIRFRPVSRAIGRGTCVAWLPTAAPLRQMLAPRSQCDFRTRLGSLAYQRVFLTYFHVGLVHSKRSRSQYPDDGAVCAHAWKRSPRDCDALECCAREIYRKELIPGSPGATGLAQSCRSYIGCGDHRCRNGRKALLFGSEQSKYWCRGRKSGPTVRHCGCLQGHVVVITDNVRTVE